MKFKKFKIWDRVERQEDEFKTDSRMMTEADVERYSRLHELFRVIATLYGRDHGPASEQEK
jgi:hypothetical protein